MSVLVTFNGTGYLLPTLGETNWAATVTAFLVDVGGAAVTTTATQTLSHKAIQLQAGTAGAPSLSFSADTASGVYQPTSGQIALSTAGNQALVINAAGQVTIPNANIDSGTIDGTVIGSITPSTIAATSITGTGTITSKAASGSVSLNSDGTGRGYVAFYNATSVNQGWMGYLNGTSLDIQVAGSANTINLYATTTNVQTALAVGTSITLNNAQTVYGKDSGGTPRALMYISADNYNNSIVPNAGTKWRVLNVAQNSELFGVANDGAVSASSYIDAQGFVRGNGIYAKAASTEMFWGVLGGFKVLQYYPSYVWTWNASNGDLVWNTPAGQQWVMRTSDNLAYNQLNSVGGFGAYLNISDTRFKTNIEPHYAGLAEILQLQPISFERIGKRNHEIGFAAQDVQKVMPHAVHPIGKPLPDGSGGIDSGDPTLAISHDSITAALVNAVKTLECRIAAIESRAKKAKPKCP